jgi:hypothetical protein
MQRASRTCKRCADSTKVGATDVSDVASPSTREEPAAYACRSAAPDCGHSDRAVPKAGACDVLAWLANRQREHLVKVDGSGIAAGQRSRGPL